VDLHEVEIDEMLSDRMCMVRSDSVSLISFLHFGQMMVGSAIDSALGGCIVAAHDSASDFLSTSSLPFSEKAICHG